MAEELDAGTIAFAQQVFLAACHDRPATVDALLARGADPARVNDRGRTALGAAVFRRSCRSCPRCCGQLSSRPTA